MSLDEIQGRRKLLLTQKAQNAQKAAEAPVRGSGADREGRLKRGTASGRMT